MQPSNDSFSAIPCFCAKVSIAYRQIHKVYAAALRPSGLSNEQVSLLLGLYRTGGLPQQELGKRFAIDRSSLSRNLRLLLGEKLVRVKKLDGKSQFVSLTPKGKAAVERVLPAWKGLQQELGALLGTAGIAELDSINDALKTITP